MDIKFRTHNYELNDQIKEYVEKKLQSFEKIFTDIKDAYVELTNDTHHKKGEVARAEITLHLFSDADHLIMGEETSSDMHEAIDLIMPKLKHQIESYKSKKEADKELIRKIKGK